MPAEVAIEPVEETCAVCMEKYRDPRLLPCAHAFCLRCLQKHYSQFRRNQRLMVVRPESDDLPCPLCRTTVKITSTEELGFLPSKPQTVSDREPTRLSDAEEQLSQSDSQSTSTSDDEQEAFERAIEQSIFDEEERERRVAAEIEQGQGDVIDAVRNLYQAVNDQCDRDFALALEFQRREDVDANNVAIVGSGTVQFPVSAQPQPHHNNDNQTHTTVDNDGNQTDSDTCCSILCNCLLYCLCCCGCCCLD